MSTQNTLNDRSHFGTHAFLDCPVTHILPSSFRDTRAKVLVLHGDADPVAPMTAVTAVMEEMGAANANWKIDIYGDARHSLTGEDVANKSTPQAGLHSQSEDRSWQTTLRFLKEVLT